MLNLSTAGLMGRLESEIGFGRVSLLGVERVDLGAIWVVL